jgi:hypothetical protein
MGRRYKPTKKDGANNSRLIIAGVIVAVVVVGALVLFNQNLPSPNPVSTASATRDWGSPNAFVTIEEYSDFQ